MEIDKQLNISAEDACVDKITLKHVAEGSKELN